MKTCKRSLYLQSGGPTAVINSTYQGLRDAVKESGEELYLSRYGISGLLKDELERVFEFEDLSFRPGSHTGSLRKMLPEDLHDPIGKTIIETLEKNGIDYAFLNGGNDSMDTAYKISEYAKLYHSPVRVIGLPKTIDNDLYGIDHTPGFGTAAKYVANATLAITYDELSYKKGKIVLIETMGRDAGFLAASSLLAKDRGLAPDYIYVPEVEFDLDSFFEKTIRTYEEKGHCIAVLSEGIRREGKLISQILGEQAKKDAFGNVLVGGVSDLLVKEFEKRGYKARNIVLNTLNRSSSFLPSLTDIEEAKEVGRMGYEYAKKGITGVMSSLRRVSSSPYQIEYVPVDLAICRRKAASFPMEYISESGDNIDDSYLAYVRPLIRGNAIPLLEDGLLA